MSLSPFGLALTVTALMLDVVRLVLVQYLVRFGVYSLGFRV